MQKQLPESVRATSSTCMVFSNFQKLTIRQLKEVCKWLTSRVFMFSGNIAECVKSDTHQFQLTADGTALTVHQNWLQSLKVTRSSHCDQFQLSCDVCLTSTLHVRTPTHAHPHSHTQPSCMVKALFQPSGLRWC